MALRSTIEANDPGLGSHMNISTGYWRKKDEEKAAREMQIAVMKLGTGNFQKQNQADRKRVESETKT